MHEFVQSNECQGVPLMGAEYRNPPAWFCLSMNLYAAALLAGHRVYECDCWYHDDYKAERHAPVGQRCREGGLTVYYIDAPELYGDRWPLAKGAK